MTPLAFLQALVDRGMSWEHAAEMARVFETSIDEAVAAAAAPKARSANAERQARFRARKAEGQGGVTHNVTGNVTDDVTHNVTLPSLDKEKSPTPPKEINPTPPPVRPLTRTNVPTPSKSFDQFWSAYPRKVGKGAARKAFAKALGKIPTEDPAATIMAALNTAKRAWADTDAQFIPHAATWLNQDRWEDEPLSAGTGPPAADDEREQAARIARIDRMTDDERKAHFAAELERWQTENPNLRAM